MLSHSQGHCFFALSLYSEVSPCASSAQQGFAIPFSKGKVTARGTRWPWPLGCHWNATSLPLVLSPKPVEKESGKRCSAQGAQGEHPRTPPGHSCWECRGSGMLCSRPFLPKSNPTQIRERWCSTTCLRCFWKMLGPLEGKELLSGKFSCSCSVGPCRESQPGIPAAGWARPEPWGSGRG